MKLLQQTNRYYLTISVILFTLTGVALYILMSVISRNEINEKLNETKAQVVEHLQNRQGMPVLYPVVEVEAVASAGKPYINDTLIYDPLENEYEKYKQEVFYQNINGKRYKIILRRSKKENRALILAVSLSIIVILLFLFAALFFMNRYISKKLWTSFYQNLETIKHFSLTPDPSPVQLISTNIQEFKELNKAIESLSEKVVSDYRVLKEFTENASHETQTPLSVIISRLEMLLQSGDLTDTQVKNIYPAYKAAKQLSSLNQNLLLLSSIEHERYTDTKPLDLQKILQTQLDSLSGFKEAKHLSIAFNKPETKTIINGNHFLTEVMISNLLKNAVMHNTENGKIRITLTGKMLILENTGKPLSGKPEDMFERFHKADYSKRSPGLGLAIVRQICRNFHWDVNYTYAAGIHSLKINF